MNSTDDNIFRSGDWTGNWSGTNSGDQDLTLSFTNGRLEGRGWDDVGSFLVKGYYNTRNREVWWNKTYPGSHEVFHAGVLDDVCIRGTWKVSRRSHGVFQIWPADEF